MKKITIYLIAIIFATGCINISAYAQSGTFSDSRDGHVYKTAKIGDQIWMTENLAFKIDTFSFVYANNESNIAKYGRLYLWKAAMVACPAGWHLPSKKDFDLLLNRFGGKDGAAFEALIPNGKSNFSASFGGGKCTWDDTESDIGKNSYIWTSSTKDNKYGWYFSVSSIYKKAYLDTDYKTAWAFSVRCLKDN